jgi:tetratricopeptide (TPR) repeat protein
MDQQLNHSPRLWHLVSLLLFTLLGTSIAGISQTEEMYRAQFDSANAAYTRGDFELAQAGYQSILEDRVHPGAEFNLGNALFKQQELGLAILHFERAKQLIPNNEDLETNLILANSQISDRIEALPTAGIANVWEGIIAPGRHLMWHRLMIAFWTLGFIAFAARLLTADFGNRRIWGTAGAVFLTLGIGFMSLSRAALSRITNDTSAIVLANESPVRSQPGASGMTLFMLHEGTKVAVIQQVELYTEIKLPNGNVGWIESNDMETI